MRSSDEHDLRAFQRRYAAATDRAHRKAFGKWLTLALVVSAILWWWIIQAGAMAWRWFLR